MSFKIIPTGIITEEIVNKLPKKGTENKVYRRIIDPDDEMTYTEDFIWTDGKWVPFSFENKVYGAYFQIFQESVKAIIEEQAQRISNLEEMISKGGER